METEEFDCETCPVARAADTLDRDNTEAWSVYQRLGSRFTVDAGLVADHLRLMVDGWPTGDVLDLLERLAVIHDVLNPPRKTTET